MCTDWTVEQNWPPSVSPALQTRSGCLDKDKSAHPSNVLSAKWCRGEPEDGSISDIASVEVGRPCKLSCDPVLVRECLDALSALLDGTKDGPDVSSEVSEGRGKESCRSKGTEKASSPPPPPSTEMDLRLSTVQVVLELLMSPVVRQGARGDTCTEESSRHTSPGPHQDGVLASWDTLLLSLSRKPDGCPSASLTVGGAQLLSTCGDSTEYAVLPTELELAWRKHLPSSPLDM